MKEPLGPGFRTPAKGNSRNGLMRSQLGGGGGQGGCVEVAREVAGGGGV